MQVEDARNIVLFRPDLDWGYLERWAGELGVQDLLRQCRGNAS